MKPLKCSKCGKHIEAGKEIVRKIRANGQWWEEIFCSDDCWADAQMAAEG